MSVFSSLFGGDAKQDSSVKDLFSVETKSVERSVQVRDRTVIDQVKEDVNEESEHSETENAPEPQPQKKQKKKERDENFDLEARYYNKLLKDEQPKDQAKEQPKEQPKEESSESDSESESSESEAAEEKPVETKPSKESQAKVVDLKEVELQKAERTVFVGNVPMSVINSKSTAKKFKQLFAKVGPVDSIRYRSISFDKALPRKLAFTQKQFHSNRHNVNAYVVFETKEISLKAVEVLNGRVFDDFHLRLDHVTHPQPKDNRRTIFVGNLDFEEQEETLWRYFNENIDNDVESVRVVRDSKTNIGKGFALVQFKDSLSVNKALLLNDKPMSAEKKRKLRISRAKGNAKPSVLSPNHIDNQKGKGRKFGSVLDSLNEKQKTKLGRSKVLGKADRATAGTKFVLEGERAKENNKRGKNLKVKKPRHKKPRIRDRSTKFKEQLKSDAASQSGEKTDSKAAPKTAPRADYKNTDKKFERGRGDKGHSRR